MSKLEHVNLFHYHGDKKEDTWVHLWWHLVLIVCALGAAIVSAHADWLWLFGGLYAIERSISKYIDNSNRNWLMHTLDWQECGDPDN